MKSKLWREILNYSYGKHESQMEIRMFFPCIGKIGAIILVAEIANFKNFSSGNNNGLEPIQMYTKYVYKFYSGIHKGRIKGYKWTLTQIAKAEARTKNSKLREFFNRKKNSIGNAKAIIALQRKIATIIWYLITNDELY
jgi:transposase